VRVRLAAAEAASLATLLLVCSHVRGEDACVAAKWKKNAMRQVSKT